VENVNLLAVKSGKAAATGIRLRLYLTQPAG
jgi:hypothetical protein